MYLGIDLGTSAVKACTIDEAGDVLSVGSAPLKTHHPFAGASEQDPADWWAAVVVALGGLPSAHRHQIKAIGLSGQMHGAVLLDRHKAPIRPAILWNDGRATAECDAILEAEPEAGLMSGARPMPGFTAPKLLWLKRHEPQAHARIAHVALPKDFIGLKLHGGLVTDPSDAAGTGWLDQAARCWSDRLCAVSATDPAWLPEIRAGFEIAGSLRMDAARALDLPVGIPVVAGAGDAAAGAVGIGAVRDGDGFISLGTSGQLFVTTQSYRPNIEGRLHAYAHTLPDKWFQMAAMLNGARPIAWFSELVDRPIDALLSEAEKAPTGPLFLPYLTGERTPHGDATIRAGFAFLDENTTQGSLMRSVVEAVAFTFADALDALAAAGSMPRILQAVGGGTRSDFLMQMIADVTGCTLTRAKGAAEGPAVGAARLAQTCVTGNAACLAVKPRSMARFAPDQAGADMHRNRLSAYRAMYPAMKTIRSHMQGL